jgi:integrase
VTGTVLPPGLDRLPSGKIRARYRDAGGRQHSKTFPERGGVRAAQAWIRAQRTAVDAGTHVAAADGKVMLEAFATERMAAWRKHKASTRVVVEGHLRNHVFPTFGAVAVGSIKPAHVEAWVAAKETELAATTLHVVFAWMRRLFADAQAQRLIRENPCDGIELPEREDREVVPMSLEAVDALYDALPEHLRATVMVAAWAGLRQGEVLGLRKHRLTLLGHRDERGHYQPPSIYVAEQLQTLTGQPRLVPPKTKKSVRRVPIPGVLVEALAAHLAAFPTEEEGFVFRNRLNDNPVRRNHFGGDIWTKAVAAAGLPKGTRFHDLRHTYASLLIEAGESVPVVCRRLGHASPVETLNTYAHLWPDNEGRTVDVLDATYERYAAKSVTGVSQADA